jgi:hypothetical protein
MLLSYNKTASASSTLNASYTPDLAFNENLRTWWSAHSGDAGEWLSVDFGNPVTMFALQVNFADQDCNITGRRPDPSDAYRYYIEYMDATEGADTWLPIPSLDRRNNTLDRPHDYTQLATPLGNVTKLRITNLHMPGGAKFSISGLRAFGLGSGSAPDVVDASGVTVTRDSFDQRHATVTWQPAAGAEFYIVRYGTRSAFARTQQDSVLFHNYQVYGSTQTEIRALVDGVGYSFTVDAVNDNGVALGDGQTHI